MKRSSRFRFPSDPIYHTAVRVVPTTEEWTLAVFPRFLGFIYSKGGATPPITFWRANQEDRGHSVLTRRPTP